MIQCMHCNNIVELYCTATSLSPGEWKGIMFQENSNLSSDEASYNGIGLLDNTNAGKIMGTVSACFSASGHKFIGATPISVHAHNSGVKN